MGFLEIVATSCWKNGGYLYDTQIGINNLWPRGYKYKTSNMSLDSGNYRDLYRLIVLPLTRDRRVAYRLRDAWILFLRFYTSLCSLISTEMLRRYILQYGNNTLKTFRYYSDDGGSISGYSLRPKQDFIPQGDWEDGVLFRGSDNLIELEKYNGWVDCAPYSTSWVYSKALEFTKIIRDTTARGHFILLQM